MKFPIHRATSARQKKLVAEASPAQSRPEFLLRKLQTYRRRSSTMVANVRRNIGCLKRCHNPAITRRTMLTGRTRMLNGKSTKIAPPKTFNLYPSQTARVQIKIPKPQPAQIARAGLVDHSSLTRRKPPGCCSGGRLNK